MKNKTPKYCGHCGKGLIQEYQIARERRYFDEFTGKEIVVPESILGTTLECPDYHTEMFPHRHYRYYKDVHAKEYT